LHATPFDVLTQIIGPRPEGEEAERYSTAERLCSFGSKESSREKIRAAKRAKRSADATMEEITGNRADSVDIAGSAPSTPVPNQTPRFDKKSVSKKEAKKMTDSKASEAQQHQQSIETARMATNSMLGRSKFGGGKKTYSWLKPGGSSSGFSSPARPNPSTPAATPDKASRPGDAPAGPPKRRLGTWREDQEKGAGIQVRDILFMLEADTRSHKHLHRGYAKVPKENRDQ